MSGDSKTEAPHLRRVRTAQDLIFYGIVLIQPSELSKMLMVIIVADYLARNQHEIGQFRVFFRSLVLTGVPVVLVFLQPDLGTSLVYGAVLATVLFLVGVPWSHFAVAGSILAILILAVLWVLLRPARQAYSATRMVPQSTMLLGDER